MERHRVDTRTAFDLRTRASQRTNVKLRRVAEYVVLTGQDPDQITLEDLADLPGYPESLPAADD